MNSSTLLPNLTCRSSFDNKIHYPQKNGRKIKGYRTTYKRICWDNPSPTITMANSSISSQNNVHPGRIKPDGTYDNAIVLTVYELMLLTGLKDNWNIPDWANERLLRHVLGECVLPLLIKHLLDNIGKETKVDYDNKGSTLLYQTIHELKKLCKKRGIKGYSKLKKKTIDRIVTCLSVIYIL